METRRESIPWSSNLISKSPYNSRFRGNPSSVLCLGEHPVLGEDGLKVRGWAECLHHLNPSPVKTWESHEKSWIFHSIGSPLPNLQETLPQTISLRTERVLEKTLSLPQDCSAQGCLTVHLVHIWLPLFCRSSYHTPRKFNSRRAELPQNVLNMVILQHSSQMSEEVLLSCLVCISYGNGGRNTVQALHRSELTCK